MLLAGKFSQSPQLGSQMSENCSGPGEPNVGSVVGCVFKLRRGVLQGLGLGYKFEESILIGEMAARAAESTKSLRREFRRLA